MKVVTVINFVKSLQFFTYVIIYYMIRYFSLHLIIPDLYYYTACNMHRNPEMWF